MGDGFFVVAQVEFPFPWKHQHAIGVWGVAKAGEKNHNGKYAEPSKTQGK